MPWKPLAKSIVHQNLGELRWGLGALGGSVSSTSVTGREGVVVSGSAASPVVGLGGWLGSDFSGSSATSDSDVVGWGSVEAPGNGDSASFFSCAICSLNRPSVIASRQVSIRGKGLSCTSNFELRSR